jgi:ABC-2 type transport system ATP-binding protein
MNITRGAAPALRPGTEGVIVAQGLTKVFHSTARRPGRFSAVRSLINPQQVAKAAVSDVSFRIDPGELVAFLGPNGAGKSTTIKMLTGILTPSAGRVEVNGLVPHRERIANARRVGAVFGQRSQLWWDLPARDSLSVLADIHGVPPQRFREQVAAFDRILELSAFWDTRARQLSLGQRVRCDLAAALIHDPAVLYLDEPTIGMDVVVKEQVREFLRDQVEHRGRTVVLTTHDMTEVERLAERVILINGGRIVFDGGIDALRRTHADALSDTADLEDVMRRAFGDQIVLDALDAAIDAAAQP